MHQCMSRVFIIFSHPTGLFQFQNFCVRDLDLFTEFFFYKVLELADWDINGKY